jgi:hypothetical protein
MRRKLRAKARSRKWKRSAGPVARFARIQPYELLILCYEREQVTKIESSGTLGCPVSVFRHFVASHCPSIHFGSRGGQHQQHLIIAVSSAGPFSGGSALF